MTSLKNKLEDLLVRHDSWLFGSWVLLLGYVLLQMSHQLSFRHYGGILLGLTLLQLPALVWSWLRVKRPNKLYFWWIEIAIYVGWPILLLIIGPPTLSQLPGFSAQLTFPLDHQNWGWAYLLGGSLVLEILIQLQRSRQQAGPYDSRWLDWLSKGGIPRLAMVVIGTFALGIVPLSNYFSPELAQRSTGSQIFYTIGALLQSLLIYSTYYLIYYVHHYFLFNRLLRQRGFLYYLGGAVGFLLLFIPLQNVFISLFPVVTELIIHPLGVFSGALEDLNFWPALIVFFLSFPFIVVVEWFRQSQTLEGLRSQQTATELQLLKQQINPHFFFNTLNNLYAMSLTQARETPESILQLSDLMRYVIYRGQEEQVRLSEEVNYLRDYLDLQCLRSHQQVDLRFQTNIENEQTLVPPLLFIILVENAFKHGIEPAGAESSLHINLVQNAKQFRFTCVNSLPDNYTPTSNSGVGLQNLRRRLAVLFPDRHHLELKPEAHQFTAQITLQI